MNDITERDFALIKMKAISRTFLKAIIENTPGSGTVAGGWDIKVEGSDIIIYNEEFGDIVNFLEGGTKSHIIWAKNKKFLRFKKPTTRAKSKGQPIPGNQAFEKDGFIFAKAVRHPGIEARLFIHRALNNTALNKKFDTEFEKLLKQKLGI